MKNFLKT